MLVNLLSDANFIILESISTGAEVELFLGVPEAQKKTCLLILDEMAVEEDKLGAFLRLALDSTDMNIDKMSMNRAIGMILYLFSASALLSIVKKRTIKQQIKSLFLKRWSALKERIISSFISNYRDCIDAVIERKIRI